MSTLRERTRLAVRDEVLTHAWVLFAIHGFEGTTVEQIAEAAGMSRRSFFRYFATKEELVLERLIEHDTRIAERLAERPADESAWTAMRQAISLLIDSYEVQSERSLALMTMLREPSLRGTLSERERRWVLTMAPLIAKRLPRSSVPADQDPRAAAVAGAALACMHAAQQTWSHHPEKPLTKLIDRAMSAVGEI